MDVRVEQEENMVSESRENLVGSEPDLSTASEDGRGSYDALDDAEDYILSQVEKKFLLCAERGDCAGVRR